MVGAGARAAGAAQTLVHISGTAGASEAGEAGAGKGAHAILAGATIQAGVCGQRGGGLVTRLASINLHWPCQAWRTRKYARLNGERHIRSEGLNGPLCGLIPRLSGNIAYLEGEEAGTAKVPLSYRAQTVSCVCLSPRPAQEASSRPLLAIVAAGHMWLPSP